MLALQGKVQKRQVPLCNVDKYILTGTGAHNAHTVYTVLWKGGLIDATNMTVPAVEGVKYQPFHSPFPW
jgi:hypothetical protein